MRFLPAGLLIVAIVVACTAFGVACSESSTTKAVQEAGKYLQNGESEKAIELLSPIVEGGNNDFALQLTLARAFFLKSVGEMEKVEDFIFQLDSTHVGPSLTERYLIEGKQKGNSVTFEVKLPNGLHVGEGIVDDGIIYTRESGSGWIRSTPGGVSTELFLSTSEILRSVPHLKIDSFESGPTRGNLATGGFSVSGKVDVRSLSEELLNEGSIEPTRASAIAERGSMNLTLWLADFDRPRWKKLRLDESYQTESEKFTGTSIIALDLTTRVPEILIPEPYRQAPARLVYSDDFTEARSGFSTAVPGDASARSVRYIPEDGELALSVVEPSRATDRSVSVTSTLSGRTFQDFAIEFDVRPTESLRSGGYGVIFRSVRVNTGYELLVNVTGSYQVRRFNLAIPPTVLKEWTPSPALVHEGVNHLMIVASGPRLSFFANGFLLVEVQDETYAAGQIVLSAAGWLQPIEVRFSSLLIFEP